MQYYFDDFGWLTSTVIPDRATQVAPPSTPLAAGMAWNHIGIPGAEWMALPTAPVVSSTAPDPTLGSVITQRAFKMRLTSNERIAIRMVAASNAVAFDYEDLLASSQTIDLSNPELLTYLQTFESIANPVSGSTGTVLATGRAAAIVNAPVQASELL